MHSQVYRHICTYIHTTDAHANTQTCNIDIQKIKHVYPYTLIHVFLGPHRYIYTEAHTFICKYVLRHAYIHSRICMQTYILPHT